VGLGAALVAKVPSGGAGSEGKSATNQVLKDVEKCPKMSMFQEERSMSKTTNATKDPMQVAAGQLKRIAKRNQAKPKGPLASATKKLIKAMQPKG
jgi:hypothetical protein